MAITYLSNVSFPAARSAINNAFNAVDTWNAGSSAPSTFQAYTPWLDTSTSPPVLKIRNGANSAWVTVLSFLGDTTTPANFVIDEDTFASDSSTKVPTQQSVKAYVDANAGTAYTDEEARDAAGAALAGGVMLQSFGFYWTNLVMSSMMMFSLVVTVISMSKMKMIGKLLY